MLRYCKNERKPYWNTACGFNLVIVVINTYVVRRWPRNGQEGQTASLCQISSKSLEPRPRCGDYSIFQDGGRRHLGFSKFKIFEGRKGQIFRGYDFTGGRIFHFPIDF